MPWHILKEGNRYVVRNQITGRLIGTHKTKEKAIKQLRLLYYLVNQGKIKEGGSTFYGSSINKDDEIYLILADESYRDKDKRVSVIDGYIYDIDLSTKRTAVYVNPTNREIIISHRGTDKSDISDLKQDALILAGNIDKSDRLKRALETVNDVMRKYPTFKISNTGHSLGSRIGSEVGLNLPIKDSKVIGFNNAGSPFEIPKNLFNKLKCSIVNSENCKKLKNQKFYTTGFDPVSISNIIHAGKTEFVLPKSLNVHTLKNFYK
jgi:hypothetical protein